MTAGRTHRGPMHDPDNAQRRYITVLFSDLSRSTELGERTDPEVLSEIMVGLVALAKSVIASHGGVVTQFQGDGIRAVFGLPSPGEDDVRHSIEAALELHEVVRASPFRELLPAGFTPTMHSGIYSGLVLVSEGDSVHGRYELFGNAVNVAAGLAGEAESDEIVVGEATIRGSLQFFDIEALPPERRRGNARTFRAVRVVERSPRTTWVDAHARRQRTPFIGRTDELRRLDEELGRVRDGDVRLVVLEGDAGMGKTRLLDQFGAAATDCDVHRGYCDPTGGAAALQPFLHILRRWFQVDPNRSARSMARGIEERLGPALREHAPALLDLLSIRRDGAAAAVPVAAISRAVRALFLDLASRRPQVLIIDDWQWSDEASRLVLLEMLRGARGHRVMGLLASRGLDPADPVGRKGTAVVLPPFGDAAIQEVVTALVPDFVEQGAVRQLAERSGGNPLFLEELCLSLAEGEPSEEAVPATLHGLVAGRIARLPEDEAEVLRAAAAIGNVVPAWLLGRVTGRDADGDAVFAALVRKGFLYPDDVAALRFKHGITRDVVYGALALHDRRGLHQKITETLESRDAPASREEHYELLAYHAAEGGDDFRALQYAELAGQKALRSGSLDPARRHFRAALAAIDRLPRSAETRARWVAISQLLSLADIYGPDPQQIVTLERAARHARDDGDSGGLAAVEYWLGCTHYALGDVRSSAEHLEGARRIARESGDAAQSAAILSALGTSQAAAAEYDGALKNLDEAIAHLRPAGDGEPPVDAAVGVAYALGCKALVIGERGDFARAEIVMGEALALARERQSVVEGALLVFDGFLALWQGRFEACGQGSRRAGAVAARVHGAAASAMSRVTSGLASFALSGRSEALEPAERAVEWLEERALRLYLSLGHAWLAEAYLEAGDADRARRHAGRAVERAAEQDPLGASSALCVLGRLADPGQGSAYFARALELAQRRSSPREEAMVGFWQGVSLADLGEPAAARRQLEPARDAFRALGMTWHEERATARLSEL